MTAASYRARRLARHVGQSVWLDAAVLGLAGGAVATWLGATVIGRACWTATTLLGVVFAAWCVGQALRRRRLGVDVIALAALVGALAVGEQLAGAIIAVMLTTGRALEAWAAGRAERELRLLVGRAPRRAHRYDGAQLRECALDDVAVGDVVLVRPGEVIPVDGVVRAGVAMIDESALTGEPIPVRHDAGELVRSGAVNAGDSFDLTATSDAADSTYAGIVRLVEQASAETSPFVRIADRFAVGFLAFSFAVAAVAFVMSGPVRAVAVLVVATPCPLILAAPVAIVAGLSRASHRGVIVKGGGVLEALGRADVLLFDKTGTLTLGRPAIVDIVTAAAFDSSEVLRLAASLDQMSPHVLAAAIVRGAHQRALPLVVPGHIAEQAGSGVRGTVDGREVSVGNGEWAGVKGDEEWVGRARALAEFEGGLCVFVGIDGQPAGALILSDPIRPDAPRTIRNLRRSGVRRVVMVTGDRREVAASVGAMLGVDAVAAEQTPAGKVDIVRAETARSGTIMVGDGINDAPALAAATIGVAVGARGATASSEAADIVLTVDRLDRLGEARFIAHRARSIALQSVVAGMGMSVVAMGVAAAGHLPATWGAMLQEVIDVAVILNALRALRAGRDEIHLDGSGATLARRFTLAHRDLRPDLSLLRVAADRLGSPAAPEVMDAVHVAQRLLVEEIVPHEQEEDRLLYPVIAGALGGSDPTATMSRAHAEIARLTAQAGMIIEHIGDAPPSAGDARELQRLLDGLYALLELHFAQEDESYLSLADDHHEASV